MLESIIATLQDIAHFLGIAIGLTLLWYPTLLHISDQYQDPDETVAQLFAGFLLLAVLLL